MESTDPDEDFEDLDEIGPTSIGKLVSEATFREYECGNCSKVFDGEQAEINALEHSQDQSHRTGWVGRGRIDDAGSEPNANISGPDRRR